MAQELVLQLLTVWSLCHANITPAVPPDLYPKPWLEALPATIVTPGTNVTLRCLAPQHACSACRFALFQAGHTTLQNVSGDLAEVFLEEVTPAQGGTYHCRYQSLSWAPDVWSSPSDALDLLVLKELPRPTLEALPGTPLSLRCAGSLGGMNFALYRVGVQDPLLYGRSPWRWADFPLPSPGAPGTYVCYYHTPSAPYVLSPRSRPFVVDGDGPLDYTQGNVARLVLAGLVVLGLGMLGACEWRSRSRPRWHQSGFQPQSQPQAWSGCSTGLDLENAV